MYSAAQLMLGIARFGLARLVASPLGGWIHNVVSLRAVFGLAIKKMLSC